MYRKLAWAAGLFDGEGSIIISADKSNPKSGEFSVQHRLVVRLGMTVKPCVDAFAETIAVGKVYSRKKRAHNNAASALRKLLPFLVAKRAEAIIGLHFAASKSTRRKDGQRLTEHVLLQRETARVELQELKHV